MKPSTNSRSVQCFDFLDLSSFHFIYFPHRLVKCTFSYNLVDAYSKKIQVLEATLHIVYEAVEDWKLNLTWVELSLFIVKIF